MFKVQKMSRICILFLLVEYDKMNQLFNCNPMYVFLSELVILKKWFAYNQIV